MGLFRRKKQDAERGGDALVLDQLRELGSDLSKPRDTHFYLYVPSLRAAHEASDDVRREGYVAMVDESAAPGGPNPWLVLASREMVVDETAIADARRLFDGLAERYEGEYDGWEAAAD